MSDTESARRQAQEDHRQNPTTPLASEQDIRNVDLRNAYNAEVERQRRGG